VTALSPLAHGSSWETQDWVSVPAGTMSSRHHHKHTREGTVEDIAFEGVAPLYRRFKSEVNEYGHDW
jgi:hypothetical protein